MLDMEVVTAEPQFSMPPEVKLKRFLHCGREAGVFTAGYIDFHEFVEMKNMTSVEEILANTPEEKHAEIVNHIVKAVADGYVIYPNSLTFVLAVCARQKISPKLRHAAYASLSNVCKTPQDLFAFVNFASKLSSGTKGWGTGIRNAINNWYLKRDPMELAEFVSKYRGFFNWTHRDLVKLTHPKATEPEKAVILKYIMSGLEGANADASKDDENTQKVLEYLERIESFKKENAPDSAANLISVNGYSVELVPQHNGLIKAHEVWMALVRIQPLNEILENLKRLSCYGFLKYNEPMEKLIVERFRDKTAIAESKLHPFEVYVYLRRYEEHAKDRAEKMNNLVKSGRCVKVIKPPAKPNAKIVAALNALLNGTTKAIVPTGLRYVVAIDLNMRTLDRVSGAAHISPIQAAVLMTVTLLRSEKNVKVVTFPPRQPSEQGDAAVETPVRPVMTPLSIDPKVGVQANVDKLKEVPCGYGNIRQPIMWAQKEKIPADVFIVISATSLGKDYESVLAEYRAEMKLPNVKFIEHVMTSGLLRPNDVDQNVFHIHGFCGKVGKVLEGFVKGVF